MPEHVQVKLGLHRMKMVIKIISPFDRMTEHGQR